MKKIYVLEWHTTYGTKRVTTVSAFTTMQRACRYAERLYRLMDWMESYRVYELDVNVHNAW